MYNSVLSWEQQSIFILKAGHLTGLFIRSNGLRRTQIQKFMVGCILVLATKVARHIMVLVLPKYSTTLCLDLFLQKTGGGNRTTQKLFLTPLAKGMMGSYCWESRQ